MSLPTLCDKHVQKQTLPNDGISKTPGNENKTPPLNIKWSLPNREVHGPVLSQGTIAEKDKTILTKVKASVLITFDL